MSVSWGITFLVIIILGLGATAKNYHDSVLWRRNQIRLDNAAIQMGQRDRAILGKLHKLNARVALLEQIHHGLHVCARVPASVAACLPKDRAVELQIQKLLEAARVQAAVEWRRNGKESAFEMRRSSLVLKMVYCPICGHAKALEPALKSLETRLLIKKSPRDMEAGYKVVYGQNESQYELVRDRR